MNGMGTYLTGDRRARIALTTTLPYPGGSAGTPTNWLNGSSTEDSSGAWFPTAISDNTGKEIAFDFGMPTIVDEATVTQGGASGVLNVTRGTWKWQGWDGAAWVDIGGSFTLGGAASQLHATLNGNTTAYRKYRMLGLGGAVSDSGWMLEIIFREDTVAIPAPPPPPAITNLTMWEYSSARPVELMPNLPVVQYTTVSPPYQVCASSKPMLGCLAGDYLDIAWTQEGTWDYGPISVDSAVEWAGMLMLRPLADTGPIQIHNAGPTINPMIITENFGKNVQRGTHHDVLNWVVIGWRVPVAGDFRVDALSYAGGGAYYAPGQTLMLHDGDFFVRRWRGTVST